MPVRRWWAVVGSALTLIGCIEPTQLVAVALTDMDVPGEAFAFGIDPATFEVGWGPHAGGSAGNRLIAPLGPPPTQALLAALAVAPVFSMQPATSVPVGTMGIGLVTIEAALPHQLRVIQDVGGAWLLKSAASRGDAVFLTGEEPGGVGFVRAVDADLADVYSEEIPAPSLVAAAPNGAVVVMGHFEAPIRVGGHSVGEVGESGQYLYSFLP